MRVLFVSPRQCWPPVSGAKLREYFLARALGRQGSLTHVFLAQPGMPQPTPADLTFCREIVSVPQPRPYTPAKILRGVVGRWPLPVVNYTSEAMEKTLAALLRREQFDLVHIDHINMAAYVPSIQRMTRAPVTYDWHNIESEAMRRYSAHSTSLLHRSYAAFTARRMAALETRTLESAFGHVVCSEREREQLKRVAPRARVAVIENGVDTCFFAEDGSLSGSRRRIVFVGAMSYHANAEAAVFFTRTIWPLIHKRFPLWQLTLVGSDPVASVAALHGEQNVEVTGTVPDVRPYYREAIAAIVPLRVGGGTRLKILEAMAAGVPVISTTLGAEGLAVSPGKDLLIADGQQDWLPHLESLSQQGAAWQQFAEAGRALVKSRYDWEVLGGLLVQTYRDWLDAPGSA